MNANLQHSVVCIRVGVGTRRIALQVGEMLHRGFDPGLAWLYAALPPGGDLAKVEAAIDEELARIRRDGPTEAELAKARKQALAGFWRGMATISGKAQSLGTYEVFHGGWNGLFSVPAKYEAVTAGQVRAAAAGETVGYGATYTLTGLSRLATIATGYADGFLRSISGPIGRPSPPAYVAGSPAPIVGRVSMDVVTIDVTDIPPAQAQRGAWAELIGRHVQVDDLADSSGTIGYEVLTRLGPRFQRIYVSGA